MVSPWCLLGATTNCQWRGCCRKIYVSVINPSPLKPSPGAREVTHESHRHTIYNHIKSYVYPDRKLLACHIRYIVAQQNCHRLWSVTVPVYYCILHIIHFAFHEKFSRDIQCTHICQVAWHKILKDIVPNPGCTHNITVPDPQDSRAHLYICWLFGHQGSTSESDGHMACSPLPAGGIRGSEGVPCGH